jgi:ubiquitin carboxyl-terminal hydrolase 47
MDSFVKEAYFARTATKRIEEQEEVAKQYLAEGEHVYELFAILIHTGGALGGHYYAYIKNFATNRWYNFNDTTVKEISDCEIHNVFGGSGSSANAYLLMYRKI